MQVQCNQLDAMPSAMGACAKSNGDIHLQFRLTYCPLSDAMDSYVLSIQSDAADKDILCPSVDNNCPNPY